MKPVFVRGGCVQEEPVNDHEVKSISWPPKIGFGIGLLYCIAGFALLFNWIGHSIEMHFKMRVMISIVILLFGFYRMAQYSPKVFRTTKKSLREKLDEMDR